MAETENINHHTLKIIEQCQVAPPPNSIPSTTLPLTFFDIPYLTPYLIPRIFFYDFPHPTQHFLQEALPNLKHSLSLTLQHFFPFVSNLILPPHPAGIPYIRYLNGDSSLSFSVAEYEASNFNILISDSPKDIRDSKPLVPSLPSEITEEDGTRVIPLMAIQVTVIPHSGFSICCRYNHLAADARSFFHFIKFWASVCKARGDDYLASTTFSGSLHLPFHDRDKVKDPKGLKLVFLRELGNSTFNKTESAGIVQDASDNMARVTVVLTRDQVEKLKKLMFVKCNTSDGSRTLHISTFVVTCSLIWACMIKSEENVGNNYDELCNFAFAADCRGHLELSFPSTYFGNCVVCGSVSIKRSFLLGENGVIEGTKAIEREVRDLKSDILKKTETFMSDLKEFGKLEKSLLIISGSPKLVVYDTDFGWGRPRKYEFLASSSKSISLSDCRNEEDGVQVGLVLERFRMNNFINRLEEQLNNITI